MKRKVLLTVLGFFGIFVALFFVQQSLQNTVAPPITTPLTSATPLSNTALNNTTAPSSQTNKNTAASVPQHTATPPISLADHETQVLSDFKIWLNSKNKHSTYAEWEQQGQELAQQRQTIMQTLIQTQPKQALAQSVTFQQYAVLPESIKNWVEQPFSKQVELIVLPNETRNKNVKAARQEGNSSYIKFDQQRLQVYRYGQRNAVLSKQNLAVQGIMLGKEAVIYDQALIPIAPAEAAYIQQHFSKPNQNPNANKTDFYTGKPIQGDAVLALAGGKILPFASSKNLQQLNTQLARLEQINHPQSTARVLEKYTQASHTSQSNTVNTEPLSQHLEKLLAKGSDWTTTVKKVLLIRVITADASGTAISQAALQTALTNSSDLIKQISYNKTSLDVTVSTQSFKLSKTTAVYSTGDAGDLLTEAKALFSAENSSVNLDNDYDIVGVHIGGERLSVDWAGLASVGGGSYWLNNTIDLTTMTHEFGHNYGLSHANFWETNNTSVVGTGSDEAYGDKFDIMGDGSAPEGYFHPQALAKLTWLEASTDWTDITTSGKYRVSRFDHESTTGIRGLRIARNGGSSDGYYWLGYRQNFDNNNYLENGAYLIWEQADVGKSWLIDTTPASFADKNADKNDAGVVLGQTYSDAAANIHITTLAKGGTAPNEWLDIQVNLGNTANNAAPTVSLTLPTTLTARTPLTFTANASDADGDNLSYQWDFSDGVIHPSSANVTHTWTVGGTYTVKITVSDMKGKTATAQETITVADPLTQWTQRTYNTTQDLYDIASNGTMLVAVGRPVLSSSDGQTWTQLKDKIGTNVILNSIVYSGSQWVAVGSDYDFSIKKWIGVIYTSSDASTWVERYKGDNELNNIAVGNNTLVAVGDAGTILSSTDGISWTTRTSGVSTTLRDIAFGDNTFVIVGGHFTGNDVMVLNSTDGSTWNNYSAGAGVADWQNLNTIEYLNQQFISSGWFSKIRYSTDKGQSFQTTRETTEIIPAFAFGDNIYFAAGIDKDASSAKINLVSIDGKKWTKFSTSATDTRNAAIFFKNTFITVGDKGSIRQSNAVTTPVTIVDADNDTIADTDDNCPNTVNQDQANQDGDALGDVCDPDRDGDGVANDQDAFPDNALENADTDSDGVGDKGDNCPTVANADQADSDKDGLGNVCDSQANIIELSGSLATYLNSITYGVASENTWVKPNSTRISQFKQVFSEFLAGNYDAAQSNALPLGYELIKYTNTDSSTTDIHYILRESATATFTGGGTYLLYPTGKNAVLQTPHPKFDSNTAIQGIETYLKVRPRLLMLAGTRRDNSTAKSACTDGNYFDSDVSHQTQSLFYAAHEVASDADKATVFIQFHGFGSTTLGTLQTQCASNNPKLINLSEGVNYATPESENSLLHILRKKVDAGGLIEACVYGNDTTSLGGTYNVQGRYSNNSSDSCNSNASVSSKRFIHLEQSSEVRSTHRADMADYIDQALTEYASVNTAIDLSSIKQYFSKTSGTYYVDGVDNLIIDDITKATTSIKMAMYDLTNKNITQALIDAHNRGISVEIITDDSNITDEKYVELMSAGITVKDDQNPNALMHNKILILDEKVVWIGSANYTVYAFYRNNENLLRIDNAALAQVYLAKFTALFSQASTPINAYLSDNLEIYFSPDHDFENRLISLINTAKTSINFLAFAFTNQEISDALIAAKARGVLIQGVFDEEQNNFQSTSKYQNLLDNGIAVKLDANLQKLHNKIFIIDDKITITGSYNFTNAANDSNDENSIIIFDTTLSQAYLTEFNTIYNAVVPVTDTDSDGINDATDPDDDNDAIPDTWEIANGLDPLDASDALNDRNSDGINNLNEYFQSLTTIWRPKPNTSWQWQLTGTIDTSLAVAMYDIDLFDTPKTTIELLQSQGKKVICYFSAGSYENWRTDKDQFPAEVLGSALDGWPDENWLDIRAIDKLAPIMRARMDLAVSKGCDGIEPDNVDAYTQSSGFSLQAADQLAYNQWLAIEAHKRGLSVGLKNNLEQIPALLQYFDFAVNEQCYQYNECDLLKPFISANKAVFGVEYQGKIGDFCPLANTAQFSWLLKTTDLDAQRTACTNTALPDTDGDGLVDVNDNCYAIANVDQADLDGDGIGNVCDKDRDGDGIDNDQDPLPDDATVDSDGDGFGDSVDVFPQDPSEWLDTDNDGVGDNADQFPNDPDKSKDSDNDGIDDSSDNCPLNANAGQEDKDNNSKGDVCDIATDPNAGSAELTPIIDIYDDWGTGFCADVVVRNTTSTTVDWTAKFKPDATITSVWGALISVPNDGVVTAEGVNYNNTLGSQASTHFGYCAKRTLDTSVIESLSAEVEYPNSEDDWSWEGGYCATVKVKNDQDHVIDWTTSFTLPSERQGMITSFWDGSYTKEGNTLTVAGVSWNNWLLPDQFTTFGFCVNTDSGSGSGDTTPPEVTAPDALTGDNALKSKTFLTAFRLAQLGTATAEDDTDGAVTARILSVNGDDIRLKNNKILLQSGRHLIVWYAEDQAGNRGIAQQYVDVLPRANFVVNQSSSEGKTVTVEAWLNGDAPSYPVEIPFTLDSSSTADSSDYQISSHTISIDQLQAGDNQANPHGTVTVNLVDDGEQESTETIIFKMDKDKLKNAVAGKKRRHKIKILNENAAPKAKLKVSQGTKKGRKVEQSNVNVTIRAEAKDPNGDTLSYDWSKTPQALVDIPESPDDPATFVFNPSSVALGKYKIQVAISDGKKTINKKKRIKVIAAKTISTTADTDNDGILDVDEAGDLNENGIPDYLEVPHDEHELPSDADGSTFLSGEPGTELGLGSIAFDSDSNSCTITEAQIQAYLTDQGLPAYQEDSGFKADKIFDYVIGSLEEAGSTSQIVLSLASPLTAQSVIRKYSINQGTWSAFSEDANNKLESLINTEGNCPDDEDTVWSTGLVVGGTCLRLTIEDGGPNDADGEANGEIDDPVAITTQQSTGGGSTGGGSTTPVVIVESNHINYFKLAIAQPLDVDASVDYTTRDGTAIAGQDYIATKGTAVIPAGKTQVLIPVEILADSTNEIDEHFSLVLSNPIGGIFPIGTTEMSVSHTIIDGSSVNESFYEGSSNHNNYFKLELNQVMETDASIAYTTRDGTAIAGQDYIATTGTATLSAGQTRLLIPVEIIADSIAEADETFSLVITNPTGGVFPAGTTEIVSTHTIVNDD